MTPTRKTERLYLTGEVADLTGVSFRRLNYWVVQGYVTPKVSPSGSGQYRRWSEKDVERVREIAAAITEALAVLQKAGLPGVGWLDGWKDRVVV